MPKVNPVCYHQSASSNNAFMKCPTLFRLTYREGIRADRDTDSQRQGTNWHAIHETYANASTEAFNHEGAQLSGDECKEIAMAAVIDLLNKAYANVPNGFDPQEWALERAILLTCFIGYQWYYTNDPIEVLASEVAFDLPLHLPKIGMPLPMDEVKRVGKIDHIIRWQGMVGVLERKSTSRAIAADSDYWDKAKKDIQVSAYAAALRDLAASDQLPARVVEAVYGSDKQGTESGPLPATPSRGRKVVSELNFGSTLYDVWHKPTIKPKMLTQADTAAFLHSGANEATREYCGQSFVVKLVTRQDDSPDLIARYTVDGETYDIEPGKKGYAMRETIGMFSARLLNDIYERPEFYFVRREIPRTDRDIRDYRAKSFAIYQTQKLMEKHGCWYENEQQCRATYACSMIPICYGPGADAVCDGKTTPPGFKRIFVDLTVRGQEVEE